MKMPATVSARITLKSRGKELWAFTLPMARVRVSRPVSVRDGSANIHLRVRQLPWSILLVKVIALLARVRLIDDVEVSV